MMKISAYESIGDWSHSVDVEYSSDSETDCAETDKFVSMILNGQSDTDIECSSEVEIEGVNEVSIPT